MPVNYALYGGKATVLLFISQVQSGHTCSGNWSETGHQVGKRFIINGARDRVNAVVSAETIFYICMTDLQVRNAQTSMY